jgi:hypothetical protein
MSKNQGTKAAAIIGLTAVGVGAIALLSSAKAQSGKNAPIKIQVQSNPIRTILSIDGQEIETPATIMLSPGAHVFSSVQKSPDLLVTWGFDKWQYNGQTVSFMSTAQVNITEPCIITAQFMMIEATANSPASLPSTSNLPLTPNLNNPNLNIIVET